MREIERFTVQADDGRTWRFALLEESTTFQPLTGGMQQAHGALVYESLDAPGRYYINKKSEGVFMLIDFESDAEDVEVRRV